MESTIYKVKTMDMYDYIEVIYRSILFCTICIASGYILMVSWIASIISTGTGFIQYIGVFIGVSMWIIFNIGVIAYLVFVAKGSFRPKDPNEEDDLEEDDDESDESDDIIEEASEEPTNE